MRCASIRQISVRLGKQKLAISPTRDAENRRSRDERQFVGARPVGVRRASPRHENEVPISGRRLEEKLARLAENRNTAEVFDPETNFDSEKAIQKHPGTARLNLCRRHAR